MIFYPDQRIRTGKSTKLKPFANCPGVICHAKKGERLIPAFLFIRLSLTNHTIKGFAFYLSKIILLKGITY